MANTTYTITTNFGAKDTLETGNTEKLILGADYDTEFNAIKTAVDAKVDASGGVIDGTVSVTGTLDVSSGTITFADDQIAEAKVSGLTEALALKADLAGPAFTGTVTFAGIVNGSERIRADSPSGATNPAFAFNSDPNTGMFGAAADTIGWATGASERMRLNATGLGIGTTSPHTKLTVENTGSDPDDGLALQSSNASNQGSSIVWTFNNDSNTAAKITTQRSAASSTNATGIQFHTASDFSDSLTLTERMRIDREGNVGIGTTAPGRTFQVETTDQITARFDNNSTQNNIELGHSTGSAMIGTAGSGDMLFYTGGDGSYLGEAEAVRIKDSGNVGINVTSPTAKLHVDGTVILEGLPTTNPNVAGQLWNDLGTLKVSAG